MTFSLPSLGGGESRGVHARAPVGRRACLSALGAFAASRMISGHARALTEESSPPSLRDAAAACGIRYGAHPYNYPPRFDAGLDRLVTEQCGLVAPVLHWPLVSPVPGRFEENADLGVAAFARSRGLPLTGAHLIWFAAVPEWFRGVSDRAAARGMLERHIRSMGARYGAETWSINVINEALEPEDGRPDGLRRDPFLQALGPDYWDIAFHAARAAFPNSLLVYNDYGMEQGKGEMRAKRWALLGRLDEMRKRDIPIDAVGLQSHLTLSKTFDEVSFAAFLREIAAREVRIILSELDVHDMSAPTAIGPRDQAVAAMYRRFLDVALSEPAVAGVITWGLTDRQSWLTAGVNPYFERPDGLPQRPLPFDAELRPKPVFTAMLEAFSAAPRRTS